MSMLEVTNLAKTFNRGSAMEHKTLRGIDLTVEEGQFVCIIGSNGAGKSTLLNAIAGEFTPDAGRVVVDGQDVTWMPEHKRARFISRVFQNPLQGTAPHLTVAENIALAYSRSKRKPLAFATGKERKKVIVEAIEGLGLNLGLESRADTPVGQLSGGQRQAIALLMSTIGNPKLLLLDEHTAALDPATAERVMELTQRIVRERNLATLMITHSMASALTIGDRTVMIDNGRIVADIAGDERASMTPADLMSLYQQKMGHALDNDEMMLDAAMG